MADNNPFAKLGSLDQKLYEHTAPKPQVEQPQKQAKQVTEAKKPANPQARKRVSQSPTQDMAEKPEKYTTRLEPYLVKKIKLYSVERDMNDYDVVRTALLEYFERNK